MLVFWKAGLVVLATPKTGSEALQEALWPHADMGIRFPPYYRHMTRAWFDKGWARILTREDRSRLQTFAIVREPISWLASWYRYRLRDDIDGQATSTKGIGFATFVESWLSDAPEPFAQVGRQSRFCAGADGVPAVDHLFAYEAPTAIRIFLETRLDIPVRTTLRNVSPNAPIALSDALEARLRVEA
ncbi:MAG: gamma-glutamyl kinase, partial [Pseudomonadota bacterium]